MLTEAAPVNDEIPEDTEETMTVVPSSEIDESQESSIKIVAESYYPRKLFEKFSGLEDGETVEVNEHAAVAFDIAHYTELQGIYPEETSSMIMRYREELVEMAQDPMYGETLFVKSAGDEFLFLQEYDSLDSYLRMCLFILDAQIKFNEVLREDAYENVKNFYREKGKNVVYIQPGVCIPKNNEKDHLAMKVADLKSKKEVVIGGQGLMSKVWASKFSGQAQIGIVEEISDASTSAESRAHSDSISQNLPKAFDDFMWGRVSELRALSVKSEQVWGVRDLEKARSIVKNTLDTYGNSERNGEYSKSVLEKPLDTIGDNLSALSERLQEGVKEELIQDRGQIAFFNVRGLNMAGLTAVETVDVNVFVVEQMASRLGEYQIDILQTELDADGNLMLVCTSGIREDEGSKPFETFLGLTDAVELLEDAEFLNELSVRAKKNVKLNASIGFVDNSSMGSEVTVFTGDKRKKPIYQNGEFVGGNAISLTARFAYGHCEEGKSCVIMPQQTVDVVRGEIPEFGEATSIDYEGEIKGFETGVIKAKVFELN